MRNNNTLQKYDDRLSNLIVMELILRLKSKRSVTLLVDLRTTKLRINYTPRSFVFIILYESTHRLVKYNNNTIISIDC